MLMTAYLLQVSKQLINIKNIVKTWADQMKSCLVLGGFSSSSSSSCVLGCRGCHVTVVAAAAATAVVVVVVVVH